jgi:minor extracellular serine protease Vpr
MSGSEASVEQIFALPRNSYKREREKMKANNAFVALLVVLMVFFVPIGFAIELSAAAKQKISPHLNILLGKSKSELIADAAKKGGLVRTMVRNGEPAFGVFIRSSATQLELVNQGADVKTWTPARAGGPGVCTAIVPLSALLRLVDNPKVTWIEPGVLARPTLDVSCAATPGGPPYVGANARAAYAWHKGTDVVVGIVDSGIDFTHGDFIKDGTNNSRILYLWDQNLSAGVGESPPSGYDYGVEYTQAQINNEIDGSPAGFVRSQDASGHGTHVAGIAAGDGSDSDGTPPPGTYMGMAPDADIIAVATTFYTTDVVDGVGYIFQRASALGKPAVVNLSLGSHIGPHDGTSSFETTLNNLLGTGKTIVSSAGNERDDNIHAEAHIANGGTVTVTFSVPTAASVLLAEIDLWYDGGDSYNVDVTAPNLSSTSVCTPGNTLHQVIGGQGTVDIDNTVLSDPNNGDGNIVIELLSPTNGTWQFGLTRVAAAGGGDFDAWLTSILLSGSSPYFTSHATAEELVAMPATHPNIIAVAAHMTKTSWTTSGGSTPSYPGGPYNLGELTWFSSPGPSRDTSAHPGYQKPDICAPGMGIASAMSKDVAYDPNAIVDDSRHVINQGTSMSAPHVAGAIALLYHRDRHLSLQQIKSFLYGSAYVDGYTGAVPNYDYGYGKLNADALVHYYTSAELWNLYE